MLPKQTVILDTSSSSVGTSKRVILVMPTILMEVLLAPEICSTTFSFTARPWVSAYLFISRVMAAPMLTIIKL